MSRLKPQHLCEIWIVKTKGGRERQKKGHSFFPEVQAKNGKISKLAMFALEYPDVIFMQFSFPSIQ